MAANAQQLRYGKAVDDLRAKLDAVLAIHREEQFGADRVCSSCLRNTTPMPGRVSYPCPTVRAIRGEQ